MLLGMTILTDRRNHELDRVNCNLNTHSMNDCLSKKSLVCGRLNLHNPCSVRFFMVMLNVESTLNSLLGQLDENCCLENIPINMNAPLNQKDFNMQWYTLMFTEHFPSWISFTVVQILFSVFSLENLFNLLWEII